MITINIIAAINNTYSIGNNGELMFRISKDLQRFQELTIGNTVLLGRKSYEEIGKPLKGRKNIVLSRDNTYKPHDDVSVIQSLNDVLEQYVDSEDILWVCGGQEVFRQAFPYVNKVYLTKIKDDSIGDTVFPFEYLELNFKEISKEGHREQGYNFEFIEYARDVYIKREKNKGSIVRGKTYMSNQVNINDYVKKLIKIELER